MCLIVYPVPSQFRLLLTISIRCVLVYVIKHHNSSSTVKGRAIRCVDIVGYQYHRYRKFWGISTRHGQHNCWCFFFPSYLLTSSLLSRLSFWFVCFDLCVGALAVQTGKTSRLRRKTCCVRLSPPAVLRLRLLTSVLHHENLRTIAVISSHG